MNPFHAVAALACFALPVAALADGPATVRDLESPVTLSKDEVIALLPGAKVERVSARGSNQNWTNDSDGTMVVYSDNRMLNAVRTSTAGKWHISDDGRYCVLIPWRGAETEEWCRFVIKASDGYYMAKATTMGNEKVFKVAIKK